MADIYVYADEAADNIDAAIALLADRQGKTRKGERVAGRSQARRRCRRLPRRPRFARLGPWTQKSYRAWLEQELLPHFGPVKIAAVDDRAIAGLVRELEQRDKKHGKGKLRQSSIENILLPLRPCSASRSRSG
jgi:hypothetical protein